MQPPMGPGPYGMMDPSQAGGLDPSLMQPPGGMPGGMMGGGLLGGGSLFGDGMGGMGGGGLLGGGSMGGGGLLGGGSSFGLANAMGGGGLMGGGAAIEVETPPQTDAAASRPAPPDISARPIPVPRSSKPGGLAPVLISSHIRTDPDAVRIQTKPDDTGVDVTLAIPMTGEVTIAPAGQGRRPARGQGLALSVAGVATGRVRLAKLEENLWKPAGIGVLVSVSDEEPPFRISRLTIAAEGGKPWTITDPTAIMALDELPNIPPGTKVTVTAAIEGDTDGVLPFIVVNGRLLHMKVVTEQQAVGSDTPSEPEPAASKVFTRSFTLTPLTVRKGKVTVRKDSGMIGVKVLNTATLTSATKAKAKLQATGWAVCFPSQESGKSAGFAELQGAGRLNRQVQAILQIIRDQEDQPKVLVADQLVDKP
jgi:hypothetical protein